MVVAAAAAAATSANLLKGQLPASTRGRLCLARSSVSQEQARVAQQKEHSASAASDKRLQQSKIRSVKALTVPQSAPSEAAVSAGAWLSMPKSSSCLRQRDALSSPSRGRERIVLDASSGSEDIFEDNPFSLAKRRFRARTSPAMCVAC